MTVAPVKEEKDYMWKTEIYKDIMKAVETGMVPDVKLPNIPKVTLPSVSITELIANYKSRMGRKLKTA